jgi:hypothetical protein
MNNVREIFRFLIYIGFIFFISMNWLPVISIFSNDMINKYLSIIVWGVLVYGFMQLIKRK